MEDDPIVVANGRPQYFPNSKMTSIIQENGRPPQLSDKLKMTLIISKWKITQLFQQIKNNLVFIYLSQPRLELSLAQLCPSLLLIYYCSDPTGELQPRLVFIPISQATHPHPTQSTLFEKVVVSLTQPCWLSNFDLKETEDQINLGQLS